MGPRSIDAIYAVQHGHFEHRERRGGPNAWPQAMASCPTQCHAQGHSLQHGMGALHMVSTWGIGCLGWSHWVATMASRGANQMYHQTPHTLPYHKAKAYLDLHGSVMCTAITADGLLATSWEGMAGTPDATCEDGDRWYEAAKVFPIDEYGRVATKPIRDWLGY